MLDSVKGLTEVEKAGRDVMSRVPVSGYGPKIAVSVAIYRSLQLDGACDRD